MVGGLREPSYEKRLQELNMCTLEQRCLQEDMITYKILNGDCMISSNNIIQARSCIHGHDLRIEEGRFRLKMCRGLLLHRVSSVLGQARCGMHYQKSVVTAENMEILNVEKTQCEGICLCVA